MKNHIVSIPYSAAICNRFQFNVSDAEYEIFADFVGNVLIHNEQHLTELATRQPQWFAKLREFVSRILAKLGVSRAERWQIESIFARAHQAALAAQAQKNPATESGRWYNMPDGSISQNWMHDSVDENYSYETLVNKPDMNIVTLSTDIPSDRTSVVRKAKENAKKIGRVNSFDGNVCVLVDDINSEVILGTDGLKHGLRRLNQGNVMYNFAVTVSAGEILKNSICINTLIPKKADASKSLILIGVAQNTDGELYIVRSIVNRFDNNLAEMDVLYAINTKKESAATKSPRFANNSLSVTDSTISIADLLELVNRYYPDILPSNVLQHFTYDERPSGKIGSSALYSITDEDVPSAPVRQNGAGAYRF